MTALSQIARDLDALDASLDWDSKWDELMGEVKAWQKDLANSFATGLSSSTAPKVAALRVSIPFAGGNA